MEKVGVYCRLSEEDRDKVNKNDDSDSIVNQRSMCLKYAKQNGWNIVDIYSDDDFSGAGTYRPDFERLINDCKNGKINLVLCKSQSRFSRDLSVVELYLHNKFIEWGVRFVSIIDNADTSNEANKKSRQINGLINEWYLDDLSRNIRKSLKNKREDGLFMGSFAPYGYDRSEQDYHKLIVDPVAAEVVKKIFQMYKEGNGYHKICKYLNDNNIPSRAIYKRQKGSRFVSNSCNYDTVMWNPDTIAQMLRNEVYIGNLVQGKKTYVSYKNHKAKRVPKKDWTRIENTHEAIIDKETWNEVQTILGKHYKPINTGEVHYLSRKVYCTCCGRAFLRSVCHVKEGKRVYLQCRSYRKGIDCENSKAIRLDKLEEILVNSINDLLDNYYDKNDLKKLYETNRKIVKNNDTEIYALEKELANLTKKINNNKAYYRKLFEEKVNATISEDLFKIMAKDYLSEIENMSQRIETINNQISSIKAVSEDKERATNILKKYRHIKELNREIVNEFIDKVYIGKIDNETKIRDIEIEWNFKF